MTRYIFKLVIIAAGVLLAPAHTAQALLNNGFQTDWVYAIRTTGEVRGFSEVDGTQQIELQTGMNFGSLTFAGTGGDDARLFVARTNTAGFGGTDISLFELDATGTIVNSTTLETIISNSSAVTFCDTPTIRYSAFHNTLFVAYNPDDNANTPATIYEIDLALSTRVHTYIGPTVLRRKVHVDINSRDGRLYVTNRNMADSPGPINTQGDLITISTAGRVVGGTTNTWTTLVNGTTFQAGDSRWTEPEAAIYRRKANPADDTVVVLMSGAGATPSLELYLDTTAHPVDGNGNLALRGASISAARAFAGQQDETTGDIWLGALNDSFLRVLRADDSTQIVTAAGTGSFLDADSPKIQPCNDPFADFDGDTDVDFEDFGSFQLCYTGSVPGIAEGCACFDHNGDDQIDSMDFTAFVACQSRSSVPADPACDD